MTTKTDILLSHVETLQQAAPAGFALAFHINFTTPRLLLQTYPEDWVAYYSENGLIMSDPTVLWGFENDGTKRWTDLEALDTAGVMAKAKDYGMVYGVTCALTDKGTRTIGSFSQSSEEFSDDQIADFSKLLLELHQMTTVGDAITPAVKKELLALSVQVLKS